MGLEGYRSARRNAAILRLLLVVIFIAVGWVAFLKTMLASGDAKMRKAETALAEGKWEDVDYYYRGARAKYLGYLKIFKQVPPQLSIVKISEVKKRYHKAKSGVKQVINHYSAIKRKNDIIDKEKKKIAEKARKRRLAGEQTAEEEVKEYTYIPAEGSVEEAAPKSPEDSASLAISEDESRGRWLEDIKEFDEAGGDNDDNYSDSQPSIVIEQEEGEIQSSKPSWLN